MQKNRWWTVFQNSNIDFVIDWYRWSINRHGSHLFREILDGGINSPWSEQFTIEIVSTKVYIRVVEYFLCANFDPSLFISSKVSYCRNSLSAFYSLFYSRIELDQFPARKSDRNDIESLSSRATSSFCACYVRKSWTPSPWTHDRKSISSTNYIGIVDYEGNSIEISIVSVQNRGNNDDTRVFLFF